MKFPMNLQNSALEISTWSMMIGTQKGHLGLILKSESDFNFVKRPDRTSLW